MPYETSSEVVIQIGSTRSSVRVYVTADRCYFMPVTHHGLQVYDDVFLTFFVVLSHSCPQKVSTTIIHHRSVILIVLVFIAVILTITLILIIITIIITIKQYILTGPAFGKVANQLSRLSPAQQAKQFASEASSQQRLVCMPG